MSSKRRSLNWGDGWTSGLIKNQGLEMILRLPQSTAIIRAMIVYNDGGIYAIPLNDVSEVLKLDSASIHGFRGTRMFSYRDAVIPLISLKELLEKRDSPRKS